MVLTLATPLNGSVEVLIRAGCTTSKIELAGSEVRIADKIAEATLLGNSWVKETFR
jgi:hypothetical protein